MINERKGRSIRRILSTFSFYIILHLTSCALTASRPDQEMSDAAVALLAAKGVQAEILAPELYRMATLVAAKANRNYRLKNYYEARSLANKARQYAERAEFESMRNGGKVDFTPPDPLAEASDPMSALPPESGIQETPDGQIQPGDLNTTDRPITEESSANPEIPKNP